MAERKTYREMLLDPRWQRKRLKILEAAGWACAICGETGRTLHVHHEDYWPGCAPWEYPDEWLTALCVDCHTEETADRADDRAAQRSDGLEVNLHRRVFNLFCSLGTPEYAEELLRELAVLHDILRHTQDAIPTDTVLWALQTPGMPEAMNDACSTWRAEHGAEAAKRTPFAVHLFRALQRSSREKE